jgi:hypothetical protein
MISPNNHPENPLPELRIILTRGAKADRLDLTTWHLEIPAGPPGSYRLAELDDYRHLPRKDFPWRPPLKLRLRARASAHFISGTWGFGLWNDPFSLRLGFGGRQRIPALPDAAWFFFASPPNYLSLRDDLPAQGNLAATFSSACIPPWLLAFTSIAIPLLAIPPLARVLRRNARRYIRESASVFSIDITGWHNYEIDWQAERVQLFLDGQSLLETTVSPAGPLGLVIWIDNQYMAFPSTGRFRSGSLETPSPAWIEIDNLRIGR